MKNMLTVTSLALLLCLANFSCNKDRIDTEKLIIIAHRGGVINETLPENSLRALEEAIRRGYTHVEVDLRCTKDGHVVCFHNENMKEKTGVDKNVSDVTLEQLKKFTLIKSQESIPTFEEYCAKCQGRINLMLDIKGCDDKHIKKYVKDINNTLTKYGLMQNALFIGEDKQGILKKFYGKAKIAWRDNLETAKTMERAKHNPGQHYFIFNHAKDFDKREIDGFHKMGLEVIVSINTFHYETGDPIKQGMNDIKRLLDLGVDGVQIDSCYDTAIFD